MLILTLALQVSITPPTVTPAAMERFALRVANPTDTPIVSVRVAVPEALSILGVDAPAGWTARIVPGSDSAAPAIEWTGSLGAREFRELAFFARLGGAVKNETLVFPVRVVRADGRERRWGPDGIAPAPVVQIQGALGVTAGGAFMLASAALGLAILALALALLRRPHRISP